MGKLDTKLCQRTFYECPLRTDIAQPFNPGRGDESFLPDPRRVADGTRLSLKRAVAKLTDRRLWAGAGERVMPQ
jgi:hypothetical protein